jgi:hypothetical protein
MLSHEQIQTFQKIWEKLFGQKIAVEETEKRGSELIRLVQLICKQPAEGKNKDINNSGQFNKNK